MSKFSLTKIVEFLDLTFSDLKKIGELDTQVTFPEYYDQFVAEVNNKALNCQDEHLKESCANLAYLCDRIQFDPDNNHFSVIPKKEFAFFSCLTGNKAEKELLLKGEQTFLDSFNRYRATKKTKEIVKKRVGCRKKKYTVEIPLPALE